jgi:hypothetical protein
MYFRVPADLQEPLLKELRQSRLKSAFKSYPLLVIIFSALVALFIFVEGHPFIHLLEKYIPSGISDERLIALTLGVIVAVTATALVFFLRQQYRDCKCQECLCCARCNAVDRFDDGNCPVCRAALTEKADFFFTTDKDEKKIIERWGLQPSRIASTDNDLMSAENGRT